MAAPSGPLPAKYRAPATRQNAQRARRQIVADRCRSLGMWPVLNGRSDAEDAGGGSNCGQVVGKRAATRRQSRTGAPVVADSATAHRLVAVGGLGPLGPSR